VAEEEEDLMGFKFWSGGIPIGVRGCEG